MEKLDCIVIGGGPAGMMCAGTLASHGIKTALIEKNRVLGKKLRITGKGRCNVTNRCDRETFFENVVDNPRFLYGPYASFGTEDTIAFFESLGVPLKTERGNRVFPVSDKASDIVDALSSYMSNAGVSVLTATCTKILVENGAVTGVQTSDGRSIYAKNVLLATGGASYRATGSDGSGYKLAAMYGHTIVDIKPFLIPVELDEEDLCRRLQGLSLKNVGLKLTRNAKTLFEDRGEMLFTHFGVSGPMVLSASCFAACGDELCVDLKPALTEDVLYKRLCTDFDKYKHKNFSNSLSDLLPSKLIDVIVDLSEIPSDKKAGEITREERKSLVRLLKGLTFTVKGLRPINEAIVTSGGISVAEVANDMQSKKIKGLYFAGEVLDVAAYTGGFNIQIAFSTAYRAALSIIKSFGE